MVWKCDTCGESIDTVDAGWVEWKVDTGVVPRGGKSDFRLVHSHGASRSGLRCQYDERSLGDGIIVGDLPLSQFVDLDGLITLLEFMSDNPSMQNQLIELIKRIHVPQYDEARGSFAAAIAAGAFEPNTKPNFHTTKQIAATIEWSNSQKE